LLVGTPFDGEPTLGTSFGLFVVGAAVICVLLYVLSAISMAVSRLRRPA
jgi:hypothetical protein